MPNHTERLDALERSVRTLIERVTKLENPAPLPPQPPPLGPPPDIEALSGRTPVELRWSKPSAGAVVGAMFDVELVGQNFVNVEIFMGGARVARAFVDSTGSRATAKINAANVSSGALVLTAHAWNSRAGASFTGEKDAGQLPLTLDNGASAPHPSPPVVTGTVPQSVNSPLGKSLRLFFNDEFSGVANPDLGGRLYIDRTKWKTTFWQGSAERTLASNGEAQYYVDPYYRGANGQLPPSDVFNPFEFRDSILSIVAKPCPPALQQNWWMGTERHILSGLLISDGMANGNFQYGYMLMSCRFPQGDGAWPAWWTLPNLNGGLGTKDPDHASDHPWPPEIDMIEAFPGLRPEVYTNGLQDEGTLAGGSNLDPWWIDTDVDLRNAFHTYGFEWDANDMVATFDGRVVAKGRTPPAYRCSMYMLINLAVGGNWWKDEAKKPNAWSVDETSMPWKFDIDYVRVYR